MTKKKFCLEHIFPLHMRENLMTREWKLDLEEIRVRVGQPIHLLYGEREEYMNENYRVTMQDIVEMMNYISNYSLYAYKDEIRQGYLTIEGGHRVGMSGVAVMEGNAVVSLQPVTFLNIRVAKECIGCAEHISPYIGDETRVYNTLIFSEPGMGKTTVLRDLVRILSSGTEWMSGKKVSVVDERSELAACHIGVPQNDLGPRTDVLCGCSKAVGISMLIRTMSPQVLVVDEMGSEADFDAVERAMYCGCRVIGTIHAGSLRELSEKPEIGHWIRREMFERYIRVERGKNGVRKYEVYDAQMERLC